MPKKTDPSIIQSYLEDSSNLAGGFADGVYLPENEAEIQEALNECAANKIFLTVSAGQTGTTGGCIPFGGWILTTQKLNKIIELNTKDNFAVVEPGVTLEQIETAVKKENLLYPPDPTEKTSTIGGNVSTNASGGRCFRFGSTRDWIRRLKIVLPGGETINAKRKNKNLNSKIEIINKFKLSKYETPNLKTSAGYYSKPDMDPIDLFIGAEGTLGIVTEIEIALRPALRQTFDLAAFFASEERAVDFVIASKQENKNSINFYEFFDANTLEMLKASYQHIPANAKAAVYIEEEINETNETVYLESWSKLLEKFGASLENCWLGMDDKQKDQLAKFRRSIPEHINEIFKQHHQVKLAADIAVPAGKFKEMFGFYDSLLTSHASRIYYVKFGHIGDNHLHVNLVAKRKEYLPLAKELILRFVKKAVSLGGTVSAEHGIGKIKHAYLKEMFGEAGINEMIELKRRFDSGFILGRGNIFSVPSR